MIIFNYLITDIHLVVLFAAGFLSVGTG